MSHILYKSYKISQAKLTDIDSIKEYRGTIYKENKEIMSNPTKEQIEISIKKSLTDKNYKYYIAIKNYKVVGSIIYNIKKDDNMIYIYHLSVLSSEYGSGLAKKLMELPEKDAIKYKINILELTVDKDNIRAIVFYTKLGYINYKEQARFYRYRKIISINKPSIINW